MPKSSVAVIVLNWNGADILPKSIDSLLKQSIPCDVVVVDNGSVDDSKRVIEEYRDQVVSLYNKKNLGFAGGVNTGLRYALQQDYKYIGLLNNDAVAGSDWVKHLIEELEKDKKNGASTCSLVSPDGKKYDSTGEIYSTWGLPYPRGRGEKVSNQYDNNQLVFAVSGGGSVYRADFFKDVGLFDEDFFAYYEDVDLSFRGQLRGWKFAFAPNAIAYHATGTTSSKVKDFTTYQTLKNLPLIIWKNVPLSLMPTILPRFILAYSLFFFRALSRGDFIPAFKGVFMVIILKPKKLWQRRFIQKNKSVSDEYMRSILVWDLPPNATALRKLRSYWWKLSGKS